MYNFATYLYKYSWSYELAMTCEYQQSSGEDLFMYYSKWYINVI